MSKNNNFGDIFCQAVDTIIQDRINSVNFDKTVICTIVDDSEKEKGKYRVDYGSSATFYAYTENTKLSKGNVVYV